MKLTIEIAMDNAAFEDQPLHEVDRILASVYAKLSASLERVKCGSDSDEEKLLDINGNTVGFMKLEK